MQQNRGDQPDGKHFAFIVKHNVRDVYGIRCGLVMGVEVYLMMCLELIMAI